MLQQVWSMEAMRFWSPFIILISCHLGQAAPLRRLRVEEHGASDLLRGVTVPQYSFAGGQATLSCSYDLRATRLYSLKWYHNGTEFYRYVPTERQSPILTKPSHKFSVTELFRNEQRVTLSLTRVGRSASGQYRCEVIAESPSFRTEVATANMTVLREPVTAPVLVGARKVYEEGETIKIACHPKQPYHPDHQPTLQWFIQGKQVESEFVKPYGDPGGRVGLSLHLPASKVWSLGGRVEAECRLTLGPHQLSSNTTIRVRGRRVNYVHNYQAQGSEWAEASSGPLNPPSGAAPVPSLISTALFALPAALIAFVVLL